MFNSLYKLWSKFEWKVLKYFVQVGRGTRGDVTILPTLVINNIQYRGIVHFSLGSIKAYHRSNLLSKVLYLFPAGILERLAVLKAICAGFKESTEPSVCLSGGYHTNGFLHK